MAKANNLLGWTPRYQPLLLWRWILLTLSLSPAAAWAQSITYSAPIVITRGGTYTGNYQSLSSGVPCVLVNTNEAVVLDGCNFSGAGNLVQSGTGANLVIRNCRGTALTPSVDNQAPGHFLDSYKSQNLVVEHNYLIGTSGIVVNRWNNNGGAGQTLTVRYNQAKNIDGRWRNAGGSTRSSFLILNTVQHVSGVEVAYNEVINTPDQSLVEDNINLYNASGTSQSPLHFHDNYIRGGYPIPATANNFTGSGMTTDGDATATTDATAYVEADHNQFVSIGNAAMNIAAGHDVYYHDNRAVNSGYLPDGRVFNSGYTGFGVFNYYNQILSIFGNNRVQNNTVGFVRWGSNLPFLNRQDEAVGACAPCNNNTHLPNPITLATEDNEWQLWQQKLQQNGLAVGPINGNTPAPVATVPGAVANPGFEADGAETGTPTGWQKVLAPGTDVHASYTERFGGTHSGSFHGTHYRPEAYEVYTYQVVTGLATGTYTFRAWVRSSGGQAIAQLQAKNYGGAQLSAAIGATNGNNWALVELKNIAVSNGQCEIGFYSKASAGQSIYFDDVELVSQVNTPPTVTLATPNSLSLGQAITLSATAADPDGTIAKVEFFNGSTKLGEDANAPYQLSWTPAIIGTYSLTAVATDDDGASTTSATVTTLIIALPVVTTPVASGSNLVVNPSFEDDGVETGNPTGWQKVLASGTDTHASYTERFGGTHSGSFHGTQYRPEDYEVYTYQVINNLPNGTYRLRAWLRSSGGQSVAQMQVKNYGGAQLSAAIGATNGNNWALVEIANVSVSNGSAEIGFYSKASAGQSIYFDDVEFISQASVLNASFEDDQSATQNPVQWTTQTSGSTPASVSYTEAYGGAHSGTYHGTHYRFIGSYTVYTYQVAKNLPAGTYKLTAWVKCSGGQTKVQMQAKNYGGPSLALSIPATPSWQWTQITLTNLAITNGQCEIGFYSNASANQSLYFDDIQLTAIPSAVTNAANSTLALADANDSSVVSLSPNPADNQVNIAMSFSDASNVTLVLTNLQGIEVTRYQRQSVVGDNQFTLDTSNVPSGVYLLQIQSNQPTPVQRLVVTH